MPSIKKNLVYNVLLSVSQVIFPIVTFPYASRVLGPRGIGEVNFVNSITQYFILFAALGIPIYGVREIARVKENKSKLNILFTELLLIHLSVTIFYSLIYFVIVLTFTHSFETIGLYWVGIGILMTNVFLIEWFFQGIEEFKFITIRSLLIRVVGIFLLFILVHNSKDVVMYYALTLIIFILSAISNFVFAKKHVKLVFANLNFRKHIKPLLYILGSTLAISAYIYLDNIILGILCGKEAVGYYSTSTKLTKILISFITALGIVLIPKLSASFKESNTERIKTLLNKSFSFVVILSIPIIVGIILLAPMIIKIFAGEAFSPSVMVLRIIAPTTLLIGLNNIFGVQMLAAMGKEKYLFISVLVGMVVSIGANFIFIPVFSQNGAALTTVLTELVVTLLTWYYARKYFSISFEIRQLIYGAGASILFLPLYYCLKLFIPNEIVSSIALVLLAVPLYFGVQIFILKNNYIIEIFRSINKKYNYARV
jgi:O-antigen/teichoic acid export membrane protein